MPSIVLAYAAQVGFGGGGAEKRVDALARVLASVADVRMVGGPDDPVAATMTSRAAAALHGIPPRFAHGFDRRLERQVRSAAMDADVVVACTLFSFPLVRAVTEPALVLDAHNVEMRVTEQLARTDPSRARRLGYRATQPWTRSFERRAARRADSVWAVSPHDKTWFEAGGAVTVLAPNGVSLPATVPGPADQPTVAFVGSLAGSFNRQGLEWLLREVWPAVRHDVPAAELLIAGAGSEAFTGDGVRPLGFVADLRDVYAQTRVAVVPIRAGGGTRLKQLEAMAWGLPVVATPVGAEGLALLQPGRDFVEADDPRAFASHLVELLTQPDLARRLGNAARVAARQYEWESALQPTVDDVKRLLETRRR